MSARGVGLVHYFDAARGCGLLRGLDGGRYFFQLRDCEALVDRLPRVGERLEFSPDSTDQRGPRAVAIARPEKGTTP